MNHTHKPTDRSSPIEAGRMLAFMDSPESPWMRRVYYDLSPEGRETLVRELKRRAPRGSLIEKNFPNPYGLYDQADVRPYLVCPFWYVENETDYLYLKELVLEVENYVYDVLGLYGDEYDGEDNDE